MAEDVLNGLICQTCGSWVEDFEEVGYPRDCEDCATKEK